MEWFRWFHGAVSDDKWPLVARKSGQSVAVVIAVWAALLECASQSEGRGSIEDFDPESMDAMLGVEEGTCQAVINALSHGKRPRIENNHIVNWYKRQPLKEDGSAERAKEWRERKKAEKEHCQNEKKLNQTHTERTANDTERTANDTERQRTHSERKRTTANEKKHRTDKIREEEIREECLNITSCEDLVLSRARDNLEGDSLGLEKDVSPPQAKIETPSIDFLELRDFYNEHGRPESPLAGFAEFKQLRAAKAWPGMSRICQAVEELMQKDQQWKAGFAPGLGKFLREQGWEKRPDTRASPPGNGKPSANEVLMRNAEISRQILEAENGKLI